MNSKKPDLTDIISSFEIKSERIKSSLDDNQKFYWFYIRLFLKQKDKARLSHEDLKVIEYHLLDKSFPEPNIRIIDSKHQFEYKFWLYGFIKVSATVIMKTGEILTLPPTNIEWQVTKDEIDLNGTRELSW